LRSHGAADTIGLRPVRRIEVKGRSAAAGDVALTRNEWIKARRLKSRRVTKQRRKGLAA